MTHRSEGLQRFVDAAFGAYSQVAGEGASRRSIAKIFAALEAPVAQTSKPGSRLPVCSFLDQALDIKTSVPALLSLVQTFGAVEPTLEWRQRKTHDASASGNFVDGHANATIVGPGGVEDRDDVWLGVSLLAPNVRYPDHFHPPEETYLVLSEGAFRHGESDWFTPGVGGSFYNTPGIKHAMRSGDRPLLAFWALWAGDPS